VNTIEFWMDETGEYRLDAMSAEQLLGVVRKLNDFYQQRTDQWERAEAALLEHVKYPVAKIKMRFYDTRGKRIGKHTVRLNEED
jgi:hypothetical protein